MEREGRLETLLRHHGTRVGAWLRSTTLLTKVGIETLYRLVLARIFIHDKANGGMPQRLFVADDKIVSVDDLSLDWLVVDVLADSNNNTCDSKIRPIRQPITLQSECSLRMQTVKRRTTDA